MRLHHLHVVTYSSDIDDKQLLSRGVTVNHLRSNLIYAKKSAPHRKIFALTCRDSSGRQMVTICPTTSYQLNVEGLANSKLLVVEQLVRSQTPVFAATVPRMCQMRIIQIQKCVKRVTYKTEYVSTYSVLYVLYHSMPIVSEIYHFCFRTNAAASTQKTVNL